jgi:two-component system, OmpR family, KDP operon response regulator KdpE
MIQLSQPSEIRVSMPIRAESNFSCQAAIMDGTMASNKPLVLLIEDDMPLRKYLRTLLSGAGYTVEEAENGEQGIRLAARMMPAVVILDLGLPDVDGQDVLRVLREKLQVPIVVLSGREQPIDKIEALDHGADDYLTKPFSTGELLARIRVALRHAALGQRAGESPMFEFGDLQVDLFARRVFVRNSEVHLTPLEYKLLATLVCHAGKVLTYSYLLREVWGTKQMEDPQNLRVFMAGLRRKLEVDPARPQFLLTEQGVGYRLAVADPFDRRRPTNGSTGPATTKTAATDGGEIA